MNLAVIPARGGSKGLPGKNIKSLLGKPLIAYSIESAQNSKLIDRVIVSTDSDEIASVAKKWNCEVLKRPDFLSSDTSTTISVIQHISEEIPEADTMIVLQPTSPLRDDSLIDECIQLYKSSDYTNLATGYYCKYLEFGTHNNLRRQDYKGFFYDDGNVYILSKDLVVQGKWSGDKIYKHVISKPQNFEIDDEIDFAILEILIQKYSNTKDTK